MRPINKELALHQVALLVQKLGDAEVPPDGVRMQYCDLAHSLGVEWGSIHGAVFPKPEDNEPNLAEAHKLALECLLEDDPLNASYWFLECAAICIRRGGQDLVAADVVEAMQRLMADESNSDLAADRATLMSIVEHYDVLASQVSS